MATGENIRKSGELLTPGGVERQQAASTRTKEFDAELIEEGTWGHRELGKARNVMTFYPYGDKHSGAIEWEVTFSDGRERFQSIGIYYAHNFDTQREELTDYDGIMGYLPVQAADLLEANGISVDRATFCESDS